ncbi:hypothetical protein HHX47_DHR4000179 [Lentinula edodes]|nr:hypothetical protein HHX47_DHR4000179 [Lentinula edodes]
MHTFMLIYLFACFLSHLITASPASGSVSSVTSTATSSSAASTTISSTGKNTKRGLSYPSTDNIPDILNVNQTKSVISWQYDWGLTPPTNLAQSGIEYVPMQWGSGGIENLSAAVKAQGTNVLLTFNEPDFNQQSNIDPKTAAQLWMQYIEPLRTDIPGIKIGAPAMYGEFGNKTIWVTEYADTSLNDTEVMDFINQTTVFMDGLDFVERYAWFGYFRPENGSAYNMLNNNGSLNDLGQFYIGADTVETSGPATNTAAGVPAAGGPTQTLATVSVAAGHAPTFIPNNAWSNHKGWQREP